MKRKTLSVILVIIAAIIFACAITILLPIQAKSAQGMSDVYSFQHLEPRKLVEVPVSWGAPISIARRPSSVTILFEYGDIIVIDTGFFRRSVYAIKIQYVDG